MKWSLPGVGSRFFNSQTRLHFSVSIPIISEPMTNNNNKFMTLPSGMSVCSDVAASFVRLKAAVIAQNTYEDVWLNLLLVAHKDIKMMIILR